MPGTIAITDLLRLEDIHVRFAAPSIIDAIPVLLQPALDHHVRSDVRDEIVASVIRREQETATTCGTLSLPHARNAHVHRFVVAVAANASGVVAGQPEPRIIFAFVSPDAKREEHLHFLASLARVSQNRALIDRIAGASDAGDVLAALRDAGL